MKSVDIVLVALMAALIVVLALVPPIPVPAMPVPVTLQTLGVMLTGLILGPRRAALAVLLYVTMALLGIPVLPGARAGLAVLIGPTGGFLLGMIPGAMVVGWLGYNASQKRGLERSAGWQIAYGWIASVVGGVGIVYLIGVPWMTWVTGLDFWKATIAVGVFLPGDLVKAVIAAVIAYQVKRSIRV